MINWLKTKKILLILITLFVIVSSFALGIHNATLYNPRHGFDGQAHLYYIKYIVQNNKLPNPNPNIKLPGIYVELHQSPLYYLLGAFLMSTTGSWKVAQYLNIFILWLIIGMSGLGLWKVFKNRNQVLIGMFSLAALPMLNIFPAMITNELLNTFWAISVAVATIFMVSASTKRQFLYCLLWASLSFIFGYWTKVSIITVLPTLLAGIVIYYVKSKSQRKFVLVSSLSVLILIIFLALPIFMRAKNIDSPSNIIPQALGRKYNLASPAFFFRLDWIYKIDMYNTQYYSFLGAAWNSFWTDGHNAITPFIKFHKKSFVLWSLGFILFPLSLYGLKKLFNKEKKYSYVILTLGTTMILTYIFLNINAGHYSAARLTYEMAIVLPYAFGIAGASMNKKLQWLIIFLLSIQFIVMVSFFWILPWWHVTK